MVGGVLIGGSWVKAVGPLLDHHSLKLDTCSTRTQKCVPPSRAERKLDFFFSPLSFGLGCSSQEKFGRTLILWGV